MKTFITILYHDSFSLAPVSSADLDLLSDSVQEDLIYLNS